MGKTLNEIALESSNNSAAVGDGITMGKTLNEIAQELKDNNKKVQLIYAFNGTGKTRLSREFKELVAPKSDTETEDTGLASNKIIYYNAFTEDLFYWDNDLQNNSEPKLKIQPNIFTQWVFEDQGQEINISKIFQHYTDEKLTPHFNKRYTFKNDEGKEIIVPAFSEVTFSYKRGNEEISENIKISKGEESCFIWSVFYSLLDQVVNMLNVAERNDRETDLFDSLEYVFIDDPVSSLDDNHLIELAVDIAESIKDSKSNLKFIITTHNPLFYNVLSNEFNHNKHFKKQCLTKTENFTYEISNSDDSPFSYHLFLLNEIQKAAETGQIYKYHFNFMRNILEKTSTFLGYGAWGDLLTPVKGDKESYIRRILNLSSHSKHSGEEIVIITDNDKRVLKHLVEEISTIYRFNSTQNTHGERAANEEQSAVGDILNETYEPTAMDSSAKVGEYLRVENILQNCDEFASKKALQSVDLQDHQAVDVVLKSQEINLDYILELIFEKNKQSQNKATLVEDVRRLIRSSVGNRAKESLVVDFINQTDLDKIEDKASIIDAFFSFAQAEQKREAEELISEEKLNVEAAKRYILASLKREFATENGTELNEILPKMSPLNPKYLTKKQTVFQKIAAFVEKFKGVGRTL